MFERIKVFIIISILIVVNIYVFPMSYLIRYASYLVSKNDVNIILKVVNEQVTKITADPSNKLIFKVEVRNLEGMSMKNIDVRLKLDPNMGMVYPKRAKTNLFGEAIFEYIPPECSSILQNMITVSITANVYNCNVKSTLNIDVIKTPVIYVHGYLSNSEIFNNMDSYFRKHNFCGKGITYDTSKSVRQGAQELENFIKLQKQIFLNNGIQVGKFVIVAHSMGGLVAREYTTAFKYVINNDVKKIIFISVPHKGSDAAILGVKYFNNDGIKDLVPDSFLFKNVFPQSINGGLNMSIQVGNILGKYDEVVGIENASLEEWHIKTDMFDIERNNINGGILPNGNLMESPVHKLILEDERVFEKVLQMIDNNIPYPSRKK